MTERALKARDCFLKGYNCAQSVCAAFCDLTGMTEAEALKLSSSFGGGFGRMREICGALTGAGIVLGALYGYDSPDDNKLKSEHYARIQNFAKAFEAQNGAILCKDLLINLNADTAPVSSPRDEKFYRTRPCLKFVEGAAELLDRFIEEKTL